MADVEAGPSSPSLDMKERTKRLHATFGTQANALLRKNVTYQKRNICTNICIIVMPVLMCILLRGLQLAINKLLSGDQYKCGCGCPLPSNQTVIPGGPRYRTASQCNAAGVPVECSPQFSDVDQIAFCPLTNPPKLPSFLQAPHLSWSAVQGSDGSYADLPPTYCQNAANQSDECFFTGLVTGQDLTLARSFSRYLLNNLTSPSEIGLPPPSAGGGNTSSSSSLPSYLDYLSIVAPGTNAFPGVTLLNDAALFTPIFLMVPSCEGAPPNVSLSYDSPIVGQQSFTLTCQPTRFLIRNNRSEINNALFNGYLNTAQRENSTSQYLAGYDFQNTSPSLFNPIVMYNSTYANFSSNSGPPTLVRFARSLNLASNSFLKTLFNSSLDLPLLFVTDFPKPGTVLSLDFASIIGPLFYMWILQLLFPVFVQYIVYEKEKNTRTMMRMHGLSDGPYWLISYAYFLVFSIAFIALFVVFGSLIGLQFFRLNSYSIQLAFYFIFGNCQIAFSIFIASFFANTRVASVVAYLYVFAGGLLGSFLFSFFLSDENFPTWGIFIMELIPCFTLYRGLYELAQSAFIGNYQGTDGTLTWSNLGEYGFSQALAIMAVEWAIFLALGLYFDQVISIGSGIKKHPLFFLDFLLKRGKKHGTHTASRASRKASTSVEEDTSADKEDVLQEREAVEKLLRGEEGEDSSSVRYPIICDNLRKVYPARDGSKSKVAVKGMSLAVGRGECFGMLGPNGAGKTTSLNMMIGFLRPTSGTAMIEGMDILEDVNSIYSVMGVCPQHDLLWEQLTGREHLLFYGRLKNLKGAELMSAVEESLKSVNLFAGGVGNKRAGQYSGGMKRRLSVAISLIGKPPVVYMDEPSTGLDPASRKNLWDVVKEAKKESCIILTTHSMEEAEALCDRLGIFVSGEFSCIGNPKQLTARFGGSFVFTVTTPPEEEEAAEKLAKSICEKSKKVYSLAGTQKFEMPVSEVELSSVFEVVEEAKKSTSITAWGIANTTLEDVFIGIARGTAGGSKLT